MANYRMNKIEIGGNTYECAEWYGYCDTSATTQTKTVYISGFTSAQLVEGCMVTIRFANAQMYNGVPKLNVSSTGAYDIVTDRSASSGAGAGFGEWQIGQIVTFVYCYPNWVIEDGCHATHNHWGRTKLTSNYEYAYAASGTSVRGATYSVVPNSVWTGNDLSKSTIFNTTTPSSWDSDSGSFDSLPFCRISNIDWSSLAEAVNAVSDMRIVKTSIGDSCFFFVYPKKLVATEDDTFYYGETYTTDGKYEVFNDGDDILIVAMDSSYAGEYTFKIELFYLSNDGLLVTLPLMDQYLKDSGYLTLADLPVWDGSVT